MWLAFGARAGRGLAEAPVDLVEVHRSVRELEERAQDARAVGVGGAVGLGVELRAPPRRARSCAIACTRQRAVVASTPESVRHVGQLVGVVLPHARPLADVAEEAVALDDLDLELADLGLGRVVDAAAGEAPEQLHAGADAEHRPAARDHDLAEAVERGRVVRGPGRRRAREHDRVRVRRVARLEVGHDLDRPAGRELRAAAAAARASASEPTPVRLGCSVSIWMIGRGPRRELTSAVGARRLRRCWIWL